jgi:hypothetical protein
MIATFILIAVRISNPKQFTQVQYVQSGAPACLLVFAELISSTLKMEAICSSETSVETRRTTLRHIPEDDTLLLRLILRQMQNDITNALIRLAMRVSSSFTRTALFLIVRLTTLRRYVEKALREAPL